MNINAAYDGLQFLRQMACSHSALAAENLFLRKQLAFYQETQDQAETAQQRSPLLPVAVVSAVRLAGGLGDRQVRYFPRWQREPSYP